MQHVLISFLFKLYANTWQVLRITMICLYILAICMNRYALVVHWFTSIWIKSLCFIHFFCIFRVQLSAIANVEVKYYTEQNESLLTFTVIILFPIIAFLRNIKTWFAFNTDFRRIYLEPICYIGSHLLQ